MDMVATPSNGNTPLIYIYQAVSNDENIQGQ